MKPIYVVTREGVYRHEIVGLYYTEQAAEERAKEAIMDERDDYHSFEIMKCQPHKAIEDGEYICSYERIGRKLSKKPAI